VADDASNRREWRTDDPGTTRSETR
jgi:hypothetical protein